jgi:HEAT repeat protein
MYKDPDLPTPHMEHVFPEKAKGLWLKALERPEADMKCKAAEAIALAHRRGVKGMETTADALVAALDQMDQDPAVRLAVARALIELDAKDAAPSLFKHAAAGPAELREIVEPALARWDYRPTRADWLARLRDAATPQRSLVLAIQGLAAVREADAADRLLELVRSDRTPGPVRLEAARALGALRDEGLEKDAERLADDDSPRGVGSRVAAVALLARHPKTSEAAVRLLQRLAEDVEPAVAAAAAARLLELDPDLAAAAADHLLASPDAGLRTLGVETLFRRPSEENVRLLAAQLADDHPEVRAKGRRSLEELAEKKELRDQIIADATRVLAGRETWEWKAGPGLAGAGLALGGGGKEAARRQAARQWRSTEQATILLVRLDHKPAAGRLVELLKSDRPEVYVTAAWGLRKLDAPETLPDVAKFVEAELKKPNRPKLPDEVPGGPGDYFDHQLSQLNQFLGRRLYAPAEPLMRQFIPRRGNSMPLPEARAAAVWALGRFHEGKADDDLAAKLEERLNDTTSLPPEDERVRWASAVALGRMKAEKARPSLEKNFGDKELSFNAVNNACCWALAQLDGKDLPAPKMIRAVQRDWFLVPND